MPLNRYYKGHGERVMSEMKKRYGGKKGEHVFYATQNARKKKSKLRRASDAELRHAPRRSSY